MNPTSQHSIDELPLIDADFHGCYSLEAMAQVAGVSLQRVTYYFEAGLLAPLPGAGETAGQFDAQALRALRRIEHLRSTCGINDAGVRLVHELLAEIDQLRAELRQRLPFG